MRPRFSRKRCVINDREEYKKMKQNLMLQGLNQMSTVHRIQMMETIWDSLLYDQSDIKSPNWHKNILADRKKKIKDGTAEFISIHALKESFRQ